MAMHLFVLRPRIVLRARVNMPSVTYPAEAITWNNGTIVNGTIRRNMMVQIGSTAGASDLGRQRINADWTNGATGYMSIGRSSKGIRDGELTLTHGAWIDVLDVRRVWAKIPRTELIGETQKQWKDGTIEYDSNNGYGDAFYPPAKPNAGAGYANTIDPTTGKITVTFSASESFQFSLASSNGISGITSGWSWDVADGTIISGSASSETITVTFPAGFRYVRLTINIPIPDTGPGIDYRISNVDVPVFARDPANDLCVQHQIVSHQITTQGQQLSFRLLDVIGDNDIMDGTLVIFWNDDPWADDNPTYRDHMQFIGWLENDTRSLRSDREGDRRERTLMAVDTTGRLLRLPGFSQVLQFAQTVPSMHGWTQTQHRHMLYYLWYLLYWHSTALEVSDLLLGTQTLNNFTVRELASDAATLFDQVETMAGMVEPDHHLACTRRNQLYLVVEPNVVNVLDRHLIPNGPMLTIWTSVSFTYDPTPKVYMLVSYGEDMDVLNPVPPVPNPAFPRFLKCVAPGLSAGQGAQMIEVSDRKVYGGDYQFRVVEGNRYAMLNAPYGRVTFTFHNADAVEMAEPALLLWTQVIWDDLPHPPYQSNRGLIREINLNYDYRKEGFSRSATVIWEPETWGDPAVALPMEQPEE